MSERITGDKVVRVLYGVKGSKMGWRNVEMWGNLSSSALLSVPDQFRTTTREVGFRSEG